MNSDPLLVICNTPKIYHPKPKRINKIMNYKEEQRKYKIKKILKKKILNLDLISTEEIENDFIEFKNKNEEIEVQKELFSLIKKTKSIKNQNRPKNPLYNNTNIELFI